MQLFDLYVYIVLIFFFPIKSASLIYNIMSSTKTSLQALNAKTNND